MKWLRSVVVFAAVFFLCCSRLLVPASCQNVDTEQPILRQVSDLPSGSLFGYSLVLHQTLADVSNPTESQNGARIVVSAPKGTVPGGTSVPRTGIVYSCPVNPGNCSPLSGKLFDINPNGVNENKTDQFLGTSMASNGERFMVCAHRHVVHLRNSGTTFSYPLGKCFYTIGRSLENFQEYQPCSITNQLFVCQAGVSSAIVPDGTDTYAFGVGAPGINYWAGGFFRLNSGSQSNRRIGDGRNDYEGYMTISGQFLTSTRRDFAISLPRSNRYFGAVNLIMNDNTLRVTSQPLAGQQMGEYYGFSLLAADLNGDGYDELLIGAPLYRANSTEPDTGRVFIYRNNMGSLQLLRTIEGRMRYSRFGYAMANLGDINGDGFDDVAISAPFTETGTSEPGTVFIYHSTPTLLLSLQPQQIIRGSDLSLSQDLTSLRGFGTSLASGVDVDMNSYNDLVIGSFLSQQVFLLRTRPIANIQTTLSTSTLIIDVGNTTRPECMFNGNPYACFDITVCATYSGRGLPPSLGLNFTVVGDTENIEQRIFFENGGSTFTPQTVVAQIDVQSCLTLKAFIRDNVMDIFNPFVIDMSIETPSRTVATGDGNGTLVDLSGFPLFALSGADKIQVETQKECGGGDCTPDLRINVTDIQSRPTDDQQSSSSSITVGLTQSVDFFVEVDNLLEDAFQATLSFTLPQNLLELVNVFNQTGRGEVSLRCVTESLTEGEDSLSLTHHSCSIGNPFNGPGNLRLRVELDPANDITGNENAVFVNFTVTSINSEEAQTIEDNSNFAVVQLSFEARANITIDDGLVTPEIVSYSDNPFLKEGEALNSSSQIGPPVDVSFLIRNTGPSRIPTAQLNILWPLSGTLTGDNYYLYITSIESTGAVTVMCTSEYINPLNLIEEEERNDQEGDPNTSVNTGSGRRKRRSTVKRTLRNKRQEVQSTEQDVSQNVTLSCLSPSPILNCVNIQCNILGLAGPSSVQVDINARLDERFFSTSKDHFFLSPSATVSIVNGDFIRSNNSSSQRSATAQVRVIPVARVPIAPGASISIPWWAILLSIVGALIVIIVVGVLLWVFGFFRRRKHEEIKQRREDLQTLNDFGMSAGDHQDRDGKDLKFFN